MSRPATETDRGRSVRGRSLDVTHGSTEERCHRACAWRRLLPDAWDGQATPGSRAFQRPLLRNRLPATPPYDLAGTLNSQPTGSKRILGRPEGKVAHCLWRVHPPSLGAHVSVEVPLPLMAVAFPILPG